MHNATTPPGHASDGEDVSERGHVLERAGKRIVPRDLVGSLGQILVVQKLEASSLEGGQALGDGNHVRDTVALLDTKPDFTVLLVVIVVFVGHEPFVDTEHTSGLQHTEDLTVDTLEAGCVHSRLDGIHGVEGVVREPHLHEVALDEAQLVREALPGSVARRALDLVVIVVQANHVHASELDHLAGRSTHTAAHIQDPHVLLQAHLERQVVLMAGNGLLEGLSVREAAEMERAAPSVLVEVGRQVVVARIASASHCIARENRE